MSSSRSSSEAPKCFSLGNPVSSGLPPFHPLVVEQGFDPNVVNSALRRDAADIRAAGYNLRGSHPYCKLKFTPTLTYVLLNLVVLAGPEKDRAIYAERLRGRRWQGTGVGYGVRGSRLPDLTVRLEGISFCHR